MLNAAIFVALVLEEVKQLGAVEAPVLVDPPQHDAVEHVRKVVEGLVTAAGQMPVGFQKSAWRPDMRDQP